MEDIYSRDNYNVSYKRFSSKMKRRPGRPPAYVNEPAVNCFVCDDKITRQKINLLQGPSTNKAGFPCQISQLLGDEFLIIVQEDDYLCKHCVTLFNNMEKFEKQLADVKGKLLVYLTKKYNLNNNSRGVSEDVTAEEYECAENGDVYADCEGDEIARQLSDLHTGNNSKSKSLKCNVCDHSITDVNEFDRHLRGHIDAAVETELNTNCESGELIEQVDSVQSVSSAVKLYKCRECSKVYLSKLSCFEHMRLCHVSSGPPTKTSDELFDKLIENTKVTDNVLSCNGCRKTFSDVNELGSHNCHGLGKLVPLDKGVNADSAEKLYNSSTLCSYRNETVDKCGELKQKYFNKNNGECDNRIFSSSECANETCAQNEMLSSTISTVKDNVDSAHEIHNDKTTVDCSSEDRDDKNRETESNDCMDQDKDDDDDDGDDDDIGAGDVVYSEDDMYSEENNSDQSDIDDSDLSEDEELEKHVCGNCGLKGDLLTLKEHFLEARLQRDLICSVCGQAFNSFCKLIKHSSGHNINSKPIECIYCPVPMVVPDLLSLNYHMKKAHLALIDEKLCTICDQMLPNVDYLEKHRANRCCLDDNESMDVGGEILKCSNGTLNSRGVDLEHSTGDTKYSCENHGDSEVKSQESLDDVNKHPVDSGCSNENHTFINFDQQTDNSSNPLNKDSTEPFPFPNDNVGDSVSNDSETVLNRNNDSNDLQMDTTGDSGDISTGEVLNVVYKCGICGEQRDTKDELLMHFESHNGSDSSNISDTAAQNFVCDICNVAFSDDISWQQHRNKHGSTSQDVMCLYCKSNFHDYIHLKYHIIYNHSYNINNLFCNLCNFRSTSNISFRNHLLTVHKSGDYFCKKCNKSFNFKYKLFKHYCKYHKSELKCEYCGVRSKNLTSHIKHERFHSLNGLNLNCNICGRSFKNLNSLKLHNTRHASDLNLFCASCELSFSDVNSLNDHMYSSHKGHSDLYCCDKCGKNFMYYNRYRIHRLNHENERLPYECKLCRAKFGSLALRAIHKNRLHKGKYVSFKCNFCDLFATKNIYFYRRHIFLHIKKYRYHCKSCLKCYTKPVRLAEHKCRVHTRCRRYNMSRNRLRKLNINEHELTNISGNREQSEAVVKTSNSMSLLYSHLRKSNMYV